MANIIIHGRLDLTPSLSDVAKSLPGQVTPKYSAQIQAARAATVAHRLDIAEDDGPIEIIQSFQGTTGKDDERSGEGR